MRVNLALKKGSFPNSLKKANVRSVYKKVVPFHKNNYKPVSILPPLLKVYERVIYEQVKLFLKFSMKFCVDSEKHIVRTMIYLNY